MNLHLAHKAAGAVLRGAQAQEAEQVQELGANEANGYTETKSRTNTSGYIFIHFTICTYQKLPIEVLEYNLSMIS